MAHAMLKRMGWAAPGYSASQYNYNIMDLSVFLFGILIINTDKIFKILRILVHTSYIIIMELFVNYRKCIQNKGNIYNDISRTTAWIEALWL